MFRSALNYLILLAEFLKGETKIIDETFFVFLNSFSQNQNSSNSVEKISTLPSYLPYVVDSINICLECLKDENELSFSFFFFYLLFLLKIMFIYFLVQKIWHQD
jgi:hypothetical protein